MRGGCAAGKSAAEERRSRGGQRAGGRTWGARESRAACRGRKRGGGAGSRAERKAPGGCDEAEEERRGGGLTPPSPPLTCAHAPLLSLLPVPTRRSYPGTAPVGMRAARDGSLGGRTDELNQRGERRGRTARAPASRRATVSQAKGRRPGRPADARPSPSLTSPRPRPPLPHPQHAPRAGHGPSAAASRRIPDRRGTAGAAMQTAPTQPGTTLDAHERRTLRAHLLLVPLGQAGVRARLGVRLRVDAVLTHQRAVPRVHRGPRADEQAPGSSQRCLLAWDLGASRGRPAEDRRARPGARRPARALRAPGAAAPALSSAPSPLPPPRPVPLPPRSHRPAPRARARRARRGHRHAARAARRTSRRAQRSPRVLSAQIIPQTTPRARPR